METSLLAFLVFIVLFVYAFISKNFINNWGIFLKQISLGVVIAIYNFLYFRNESRFSFEDLKIALLSAVIFVLPVVANLSIEKNKGELNGKNFSEREKEEIKKSWRLKVFFTIAVVHFLSFILIENFIRTMIDVVFLFCAFTINRIGDYLTVSGNEDEGAADGYYIQLLFLFVMALLLLG